MDFDLTDCTLPVPRNAGLADEATDSDASDFVLEVYRCSVVKDLTELA